MIATAFFLSAGVGPAYLRAQEPQNEQTVQVDSTGLKLRTDLMGAKTTSDKKKALTAYGEWILENKNPDEARQFMALVSYDKYHNKMEWEAGGYLAAMVGLGIVPIDTSVAVFGSIKCPVDTALSFVKGKAGEEAKINAIFNFALYRKIDPLKAVARMAGTKNAYGLSKAIELVGLGQKEVGEPSSVVGALGEYGNMVMVMSELLGNEALWANLPYMVGLLDATIKKSSPNEKQANMERLGHAVYERVKNGTRSDLARWFVISQSSNASSAENQYASASFLLCGAGFYPSADTTIGLAKNYGSNPEVVLQNFYAYYTAGFVPIDAYLSIVQRSGEFYYCTPEQAVEYMCKTGNKKALKQSIAFIETYGAAAGDARSLSSSLYSHFSVVDAFESFINSKLGKRKDAYVVPFYSNAIYYAKMDETDRIVEIVAGKIDGDYDLAKKVVDDLKSNDKLKSRRLIAQMVKNAVKAFDTAWGAWVKNPNSQNEGKLNPVLEFLVEGYGSNDEATKKLNDILLDNKYTESQKVKIKYLIELKAKTDPQAAAAYKLLKGEISNGNGISDNTKIIKTFLDDATPRELTDFKSFRNYTSKSKTDMKEIIKEMAGSITTFKQDIQKILNGKKGKERKILIWVIVETVCEGEMSAPILIAMELLKDDVLNRTEAEQLLAHISVTNNNKNLGIEAWRINEMEKWIINNRTENSY